MISWQNVNAKLYIPVIPHRLFLYTCHIGTGGSAPLQPETRKSFKNPKPDGLDPTVRITEKNHPYGTESGSILWGAAPPGPLGISNMMWHVASGT
jgi:hypothetical protein